METLKSNFREEMETDQKIMETYIWIRILCLILKYLTARKQPIGIDNNNGVKKAIPASPNLVFTLMISLFFLVNFLPVGIFPSRHLCSLLFLSLSTIFSLSRTNIVQPTIPPHEVMVTASKKENPSPSAMGTAPNTNFTVLNKNTDTISHQDSTF